MTSNLHEFIGMVTIVCSATFFILMFRWGIYRFGRFEDQVNAAQADSARLTRR